MTGERRLPWILCAIALAACPASVARPPLPVPPLPPKPSTTDEARWVILDRPKTSSAPRTIGGSSISVGSFGDRWTLDGGHARHAATFATNRLVDVLPAPTTKGEGFVFVDTIGAVHIADEPLGAFVAHHSPASPLHGVAVGKRAIVGIDLRGRLARSDDEGATWKIVPLPGAAGSIATEVVMHQDGTGEVLLAPAARAITTNDGASFAVVASVDATTLSPADTEVSASQWSPHWAFVKWGAVAGGRIYATHRSSTEMRLESRALDGSDAPQMLGQIPNCDAPQIAVNGQRVVVVCWEPGDLKWPARNAVFVNVSEDGGKTFREEFRLFAARMWGTPVWLGPDGTLVIDGACRMVGAKCEGHTWVRPGPSGAPVPATVAGKPIGTVFGVEFLEGGGIFAVATVETKPGVYADQLLRSIDSGATFTGQSLPDEVVPERRWPNPTLPKRRLVKMLEVGTASLHATFAVDEAGKLRGFAVEVQYVARMFVVNESGTKITEKPAPFELAPSFAGLRGLVNGRDGWLETGDGGATWQKLDVPGPLQSESRHVACLPEGCLVDDVVARLGWGTTGQTWSTPPPKPPKAAGTFRCTMTSTTPFSGRLTSDDVSVVTTPEAPLRFAIAFAHAGKGATSGASVALDRGDGLKVEPLVAPRMDGGAELSTVPGGVVALVGDKNGSMLGWVTNTGKVVSPKKALLTGSVAGLDGDAVLIDDDDKLRRFGPQGLGPVIGALGYENERDRAFMRVGADLLRLLHDERRVELARLGKQGFEKLQEVVPWPGNSDPILGLAGGVPSVWFLSEEQQDPFARVLLRFSGPAQAMESRPLVSGELNSDVTCDAAHATWPRVVIPEPDGKHHPIRIDGIVTDAPYWLATSALVVGVGPTGDTCRDALIVSAPWENAEGYLRLDAGMKGAVVRSSGSDQIAVHGLTCKPSEDPAPDAFADWSGF